MAKDKQYTGADIQELTDREHVRIRTQVYLGGMHPATYTIPMLSAEEFSIQEVEFIPAVYKALSEVVDNSIDEFSQITTRNKTLTIKAKPEEGWFSVADNGRGIPIDQRPTGKYTPEVALASLKAGRNFSDDKEVGTIGQNGVGAACTNYCSSVFEVQINREGKKYEQKFTNGAEKASKPKITTTGGKTTGTQVSFQLDPKVFKNVALPEDLVRNRAMEIALTNPSITVVYNDEQFRYKRGLVEFVEQFAAGKTFYSFKIDEPNVTGEIFLIPQAHDGLDEQMYTWVNSSMLFDGGKCNTQFFNAIFDRTITHLEREAKKTKSEVTRNDVRRGLLALADLKIRNPEYDSQAKTRLTGPDLRKEITSAVDANWKTFSKQVDAWLQDVLVHAQERHHKQADKKAIDEFQKTMRKRVDGLLDATSKVRSQCQVLVTEGLSAKSSICEARNPETTAAFALTGKINNVYTSTPAQVLKMGKVTDLLSAIGLTPGKRAVRSDLNFGRIVIATDADVDGGDIFTLLVNLLYKFWPELFDKNYEPVVYRLVSPNVVASKGDKRVHFTTRADFEKISDKYKGWTIEYMKGLGSLSMKDWEMVLASESAVYIPIVDDGNISTTLKLLFSDDSDARKAWLQVDG